MVDIAIRPFLPADRDGVLDVILPIQTQEFAVAVTAADQPDLMDIPAFYQTGKGNFWVAVADGTVIGTIGLRDIGNDQAALRKMFVAAPYRGREHGIAKRLLDGLTDHAAQAGLKQVILGTTDKFLAAHRFYEKNGFAEIGREALPETFPVMAVDSKFYLREI